VIKLKLNVDVMGNARFAFSPLAEAVSSLCVLKDPRPSHLHRPWASQARERLGDHDLSLLRSLTPPGSWQANFLHPRAISPTTTIEDQLGELQQVPPERIREELVCVWGGRDLPRQAEQLVAAGARGPVMVAEALWEYWQLAVAPFWTRMCGVLEEDVAHRASQAMQGGLFDLLEDLHSEISIEGHTLQVRKPHLPDCTYEGAHLTLVPSIFIWPSLLIAHQAPGCFELTYGARGVGRVWDGLNETSGAGDHLGALLGRGRAAVLTLLRTPMSTTQIARSLGQSGGSVSRHLSVLRETGLVVSWRSGRSVLYAQTPLAQALSGVNEEHHIGRGRPGAPLHLSRQEA
jgi:DNA-binding transcriptional ArsR family regulator